MGHSCTLSDEVWNSSQRPDKEEGGVRGLGGVSLICSPLECSLGPGGTSCSLELLFLYPLTFALVLLAKFPVTLLPGKS